MPRLVRLWFSQCTGFSCNSQQNWFNHFWWSIVVDQFFQICFWCVGFDTLLNLVALNMYGSSRRAIVSMILTPTSIRIHPKAMHPYPLYSIPGMLQQSGRRILHTKFITRLGHGQLRHLLHCRGKEVGMADDGRYVVHSLCWNELTTTCDRGLRYKPSCFQQHQMIFQKCLKLVGRKWFPFRRFLMAGRSAVFSQMNAECTPTFSLFLYWQDPFTLPCVTAKQIQHITTIYQLYIFCQCFRSSSHSFRHVMLATIQALSSLCWFAPWWSARFSNLTVQIIERCPKRAPRMPAQARYRPRRASLEPKVSSRTGIFKCVVYAMQNGFGTQFLQRSRSSQASIFAFWWILSIRRIELIYDTIFRLNNKYTIIHCIYIILYHLIVWYFSERSTSPLCVHWNLPRGAHLAGSSRGSLVSDVNWCQLTSSHEILKKSGHCRHAKHGTWFRGRYLEEAMHMFWWFESKLQFS